MDKSFLYLRIFFLAFLIIWTENPPIAWGAWTIESLGEGGETVRYAETSSMALDSNGKVHIAYVNNSDKLRYATNASGTWVYQTPYSPWYWDAVIAIDSNNKVHIIGGNNMRTYATNASGSWVVTTIGSSFNWDYTTAEMRANIAIDSNNKLYKGYTSYNFGSGPDIRYGSNVWGFWGYDNIDTSLVSGGDPVPIAIDSIDKIHVAYYNDYNCDLKYATNASGSWVTAIIDNSACADGPSISIDSNNKAHIGYESSGWGHVKYLTNVSGSWVSTTLDTSDYPMAIDRGIFIATDSNNKVHLSYANTFNYLRYATNASGSWVYTTVDTGSFSRTAIAVGSATNAHIIYTPTGSPYTLKHATNAGGGGGYVDCGLRVSDGVSPSPIILSCEDPLVTQCGSVGNTDSLCINTQSKKYGIKLVDPADANASRVRIGAPDGAGGTVIKALRKQ